VWWSLPHWSAAAAAGKEVGRRVRADDAGGAHSDGADPRADGRQRRERRGWMTDEGTSTAGVWQWYGTTRARLPVVYSLRPKYLHSLTSAFHV
jgi:hypothetical protein